MKSNYKNIGDYIKQVDERNIDLKIQKLLGLSISKEFIPSVANTVGTDMKNYKIIRKNQFACSMMQVRRDKKMPIALQQLDEAIISQAYPVFEVKDESKLLPEYLMMWFSREEFDREACFHAVGGVRGSLEWEDFEMMKVPIPNIDTQRTLVTEYKSIQNRIDINQKIIQKLESTANAIYKELFVSNIEFDSLPEGWQLGTLFDLIELQRGFDLPSQNRIAGDYPIYASTGTREMHNEFKVKGPGIVTGRSGSLGEVFYIDEDFWPLNTTLWVKKFKAATPIYAYYVLKGINIIDYNGGSAVPTLNRNDIHRHEVVIPKYDLIKKFEEQQKVFFKNVKNLHKENMKLDELKKILLAKMAHN